MLHGKLAGVFNLENTEWIDIILNAAGKKKIIAQPQALI